MGNAKKECIEKHIAQWKHNRQFAKTIEARFRDWQITVIFYIALHVVDAALASLEVPGITNHTKRNDAVKANESFAGVRTKYLDLYRISRITRYEADPDHWIPQEYLNIGDLINGLLKPIENGVGPLISRSVKFDPLELQD